MEDISKSQEYSTFRATVPQRKVVVDSDAKKEWTVYDAGPRTIKCPLVCLPPVSGTADVFYRQIQSLSMLGYRIISVDYPVYWSVDDFCDGLQRLVSYLELNVVHLFGASLGGFLCQKFAERYSSTVVSLILCNTFSDTAVFQYTTAAHAFWMMPAVLLRKTVLFGFDKSEPDRDIKNSMAFMRRKMSSLSQSKLASRLMLNCVDSYVEPQMLAGQTVTIIDVFDKSALGDTVKEDMYKCYPNARRAHMKTGGDFPYLSRAEETNLYIQIHFRSFEGTKESPRSENPSDVQHSDQSLDEQHDITDSDEDY